MILFLSSSVPPRLSGQSAIVQNLATQFTREEMVVVGKGVPDGPAFDWPDNGPEIIYATARWGSDRRGAKWWARMQFPLLLFKTMATAIRHKCTILIVVSPPADVVLAGLLAAKLTGMRFFPYFHNLYHVPSTTGEKRDRFADWLQTRVFEAAEHVFVMSDGMVEFFNEMYPELPCSAFVHSFSEELPTFASLPHTHSPLRVVISGNINDTCRDAVQRLCEALQPRTDVSVTLFGGTAPERLRRFGILDSGAQKAPPLPRKQFLEGLREADILFLPLGLTGILPDEEYRTIFPTRTIEYLIAGRPILAHAPEDSFLTRFLRQQKCALVVTEPSAEKLLEAVERLRDDASLRAELVQGALKTAEMFQAPRVAETLRRRVRM